MSSAKSAQDQLTNEQHLANLRGIVEGTRTIMLLSHGGGGRIDGCPMAIVKTGPDDALYLTTSIDAAKLVELQREPHVTISACHEGFAIIEGTARVSQDRALIDELWKDSWSAWYPDGKTDPTIAILIVQPERGTYWDTSMTTGLSYVFRALKAKPAGKDLDLKPGDGGHVEMGRGCTSATSRRFR